MPDRAQPRARGALFQLAVALGGVIAGLVLFTMWVEWWFVPTWLAHHYRGLTPILRDRTSGRELGILFELLPAPAADNRLRVALVGDSSVGGLASVNELAASLHHHLRQRSFGRTVEVIDLSIIGLGAQDALILIAKVLASRPDLVVYAVSPRVVPTLPLAATNAKELALDWDVVSRLGYRRALEMAGPSLPSSLVHGLWPPMRVQRGLREAFREEALRYITPALAGLADHVFAPPNLEPQRWLRSRPNGPMWARMDYRLAPPTPSTTALDAIVELCARERRCLLYHVPVNPVAVLGFEDGMVEEFARWMREKTEVAGVPFRDFRGYGRPASFLVNSNGNPDAIHPTKAGHGAFAPILATAIIQELRR